jgi:hypothetical protein
MAKANNMRSAKGKGGSFLHTARGIDICHDVQVGIDAAWLRRISQLRVLGILAERELLKFTPLTPVF